MKKLAVIFTLALLTALAFAQGSPKKNAEGTKIRIITNTATIIVTLNGSDAAADLAALLPFETTLVERMGFAKSISLPKKLRSHEETTWDFEVGNLNYWDAGPSVSMPYNHKYDHTAVAVIPVGKADDPKQAEKLAGATGKVRVELAR